MDFVWHPNVGSDSECIARNESESPLPDVPLSGVNVLDFTSVVVGPVATQFLANYRAEVIKIEAPGGDLLRRMGGQSRTGELSPKFLQMNRNKRSLVIDLREGQATIHSIMRSVDVIVVNMRAPALEKLGLTYEDACHVNARIVHCNLMGFGKHGRYFGKPAYDTIIQGGAGVAACNQRLTGTPQFVPMVLADHLVALIAVQMILLALATTTVNSLRSVPVTLGLAVRESVIDIQYTRNHLLCVYDIGSVTMKSETIRTNIVVDTQLIEAGLKATGLKTRRELVDFALRELLRHKQQRKILSLKGKVKWDGDLSDMRTGYTG